MREPLEDIDGIMAVMDAAFPPDFGEAWSRRQVTDALAVGNCHYRLVDERGEALAIGEPAAGFYLSRAGYEDEELLLLAVTPAYRRHGLGRALLELLSADAIARGKQRLLLEMRRGNPAEALYRSFGFATIGERRDYYRLRDGRRLDAITFAKYVD